MAWKIQDPKRFVETVGDPVAAEMRLHDIVWSGLSAALGTHDLDSIISTSPDKIQAQEVLDNLTASTDRAALAQYGIQVIDVRIKRLNLPEQNKQSVYARMRAERERIARQYRAEGEEQALRIRADADRQKEEIALGRLQGGREDQGRGGRRIHAHLQPGLFAEPAVLQAAAHAGSPTRRFSTTRPPPS